MKSGGVCTWRETTVTCFARRVSWSTRFEEMTSSYVLDKREIMWDNAEMGHVVGGKIRPGLWHVLGAFHRTWILTTRGEGQIVVTRYFLLLGNPPHCNLPSHSENNWDNPQTSRRKIWMSSCYISMHSHCDVVWTGIRIAAFLFKLFK